jgi:hypothetical protein
MKRGGSSASSVYGPENSDWWLIELWRLGTDGSTVPRSPITASISSYSGLLEVRNLAVCPCAL